ncbi:MAG: MBL fold metallo-hydrolase, partial [Candidatus Marinimicrobia bacterium]|nr:MBL fold metallo-hydrolase [Candidatus Neomarinimicrobiota bacterium]
MEYERFALDGGAMFGVVPKTLWNRTNPADEKNRIEMALRSLLIVGDGRVILIDAGIGTKWNPKFLEIYKIDFEKSNVVKSLANAGFSPEEVTDVIVTHLHFDHIGGSTKIENGRIVPVFPNAKFHIQKKHWDWAI